MATVRGDLNATLKDLTAIVEDTVAETRPNLYPLICSVRPDPGAAYTKIPIAANMPFPRKFEAERAKMGKDVTVVQTFTQDTYELTIELDSDLVQDARAYSFSDLVREATIAAKLFPDYQASQAVINGYTSKSYDGTNNFYGTTKKFANAGKNNINNTVAQTGTTVPYLAADVSSAVTQIRTFLDNAGRLLNPVARQGQGQLLLQCSVALQQQMNQMVFGSMIPINVAPTAAPYSGATGVTTASGVANNTLQGIADIFADGYLDAAAAAGVSGITSTTFFLHYVGMPQRPFVFIEDYPMRVNVLGIGSEHEVKTNKVMICLKHRFVLGYYRFDRSVKVG